MKQPHLNVFLSDEKGHQALSDLLSIDELEAATRLMNDSVDMLLSGGNNLTAEEDLDYIAAYRRLYHIFKTLLKAAEGKEVEP